MIDKFNDFALIDFNSDSMDRLLVKMHGFDSIIQISMYLRYHFFDSKTSLFDENTPHLIIQEQTNNNYYESISELIIYHQDFGPVFAIAPRENFEDDIYHKDIGLPVGIDSTGPFSDWSIERMLNWFTVKLTSNFKNHMNLSK